MNTHFYFSFKGVLPIWIKDWCRNRAGTPWQNWSPVSIAISENRKEKRRSLSESSALRNLRIHFEWKISTRFRANETNHPRQATWIPTLFEQPTTQERWDGKERKSCTRQDVSIFVVNPRWIQKGVWQLVTNHQRIGVAGQIGCWGD